MRTYQLLTLTLSPSDGERVLQRARLEVSPVGPERLMLKDFRLHSL
jgi:hypothetical protein